MNFTPNRLSPPVVLPAQSVEPGRGSAANNHLLLFNPAPYPKVTGRDPETAALLKQDYAGAVSELTAVTQYIFQNTVLHDETLANAMLQIAIVEMTHLDMLGDAIEELGGTPHFENGSYYWNAQYVDYSTEIEDILEANIQAETQAIENYQRRATQTRNKSVSEFLLRLVEDEKLHLKFFEETLMRMRPQRRRIL